MNLVYSRNPKGNFGDDLNPYIFNFLFKDLFQNEKTKSIDFLGIGTIIGSEGILTQEIESDKKNVFFGTGVRNLSMQYDIKDWDIRFLRGPISSNILGLKNQKFITDGAYAYTALPEYEGFLNSKKNYKYSFMPHLSHTDYINWDKIGNQMGIHIISPHQDVKKSLKEISETEYFIAGAMHGAIMADVLRIPFIRLKMEAINSESSLMSDFKWLDWLSSMDLKDINVHVKNVYLLNNNFSDRIRYFFFIKELKSKLKSIKKNLNLFQLSDDKIFKTKTQLILNEKDKLINDYD